MSTTTLRKDYQERIVPALTEKFNYTTPMQVPKLKKIVINQGLGRATQDKKLIEISINELTAITGQKAVQTLSKKDLRKQRAAERAKIAPKVKELKRRIETAETKIDELQKALDEASAELFNPTPTTDFAEANRRVRTLQFEIDRYTADWEEAATELEELQKGEPA